MPKPKQTKPVVKNLDVPCSLCEKRHDAIPKAEWWEIGTWGPTRRAHSTCFLEVMDRLRDMADGEFLAMLEARELEQQAISIDHAEAATEAQIATWHNAGPSSIDTLGDEGEIWKVIERRADASS